jgi:hypothetical protein
MESLQTVPSREEVKRLARNASALKRSRENREMLAKIKLEKGCCRCGYNGHHSALDFNHIDPSTKKFNLGEVGHRSIKLIMAEVEKCEVMCANCHRIHTYETHPSRMGKS